MPPLIQIEDITKVYQMGSELVNALRGVSLSIDASEYVAIMGASGSGKSTLMHIIGCLDRPTQGKYILAGKSVEHLSDDELAGVRNETIGFIFQQFNLLPQMTAMGNVMLPLTYAGVLKEERMTRAKELLTRVNLSDRLNHKPTELSGGQQQRVSIARALANQPKLLLADEPTGALDSQTAAEFMALIDQLVDQGMTVIVVTHDPETASHAQRLIRIKDGLIIDDIKQAKKVKAHV
jgi:putative ABC transport system ATP-binding protein